MRGRKYYTINQTTVDKIQKLADYWRVKPNIALERIVANIPMDLIEKGGNQNENQEKNSIYTIN